MKTHPHKEQDIGSSCENDQGMTSITGWLSQHRRQLHLNWTCNSLEVLEVDTLQSLCTTGAHPAREMQGDRGSWMGCKSGRNSMDFPCQCCSLTGDTCCISSKVELVFNIFSVTGVYESFVLLPVLYRLCNCCMDDKTQQLLHG